MANLDIIFSLVVHEAPDQIVYLFRGDPDSSSLLTALGRQHATYRRATIGRAADCHAAIASRDTTGLWVLKTRPPALDSPNRAIRPCLFSLFIRTDSGAFSQLTNRTDQAAIENPHPENTVDGSKLGPRPPMDQARELVAQRNVLGDEIGTVLDDGRNNGEK